MKIWELNLQRELPQIYVNKQSIYISIGHNFIFGNFIIQFHIFTKTVCYQIYYNTGYVSNTFRSQSFVFNTSWNSATFASEVSCVVWSCMKLYV